VPLDLPDGPRYVLPEQATDYQTAFDPDAAAQVAGDGRRAILRRALSTHGPLTHGWLLERYPWPADWLDEALEALIETGEIVTGQISPTTPDTRHPLPDPGSHIPEPDPRSPITDTRFPLPEPEYCDRRNLERIHRHTLSMLRKEVEPVSLYAYAEFLARWQHLNSTERLSGPGALVQLLQILRGLPAPGIVWERDLLPLRLDAFDPKELEALCGRGEVVWAASGGKDPGRARTRTARIRFFFRGEGHLFLPPEPEEPELSPTASEVLAFLKSEGACFLADLEAGSDLAGPKLEAALVELVLNGLVTNDTLEGLRGVLAWTRAEEGPAGKPISSLQAELSAWRQERGPARPVGRRLPSRARFEAARRSVARRTQRETTPRWPGRWSLVHRIGVWGREVAPEERLARQARQLLQCYGIVTRESLERWEEGLDWGPLYAQFQLMEMRGEVRRGYFVQGLPGVQFALPEAVEKLREWTRVPGPAPDEGQAASDLVLLNACDPANLFGPSAARPVETLDDTAEAEEAMAEEPETPDNGEITDESEPARDPARFARIPANWLVLLRGRPVLLLETGGERLTTLPDLAPSTLHRALQLAVEHVGGQQRRLTLSQWNGEPILDSAAAPVLERLGFRREALDYVREG
jgi:ATP-dependent Lhr-like helicase